jgi:predicted transcriptional regulator
MNSPAQSPERRKSQLRFETLNAFVDFGAVQANLTPAGVCVWLALWRFANPDGTTMVSTDKIAACFNLNKRTVLRALKELKRQKMIKVLARGGINRGASKYVIRGFPLGQIKNP